MNINIVKIVEFVDSYVQSKFSLTLVLYLQGLTKSCIVSISSHWLLYFFYVCPLVSVLTVFARSVQNFFLYKIPVKEKCSFINFVMLQIYNICLLLLDSFIHICSLLCHSFIHICLLFCDGFNMYIYICLLLCYSFIHICDLLCDCL